MKKIRIYIADDHQLIVEGLQRLLLDQDDIIFVGSSNNGLEAEQDILQKEPDIALLDIRMPGKDGLKITQNLFHLQSPTKVIILSMYEDIRYINDAKNFGAYGYLLKNTCREEFLEAIHLVQTGKKIFHKIEAKQTKELIFLTPREKDIIKELSHGKTNQEIADELSLSVQTVMTHRKNIRAKTGTKNLANLLLVLKEQGIDLE
ncbi:MAG: response regulator transcription factor [Bacteroidia bacterium]|nr:response regulator transcription factor [Bacteroidia bacterium]MCF8426102.1 response regulator transcription factor [Bacteroidia bacterium]